MGRGRPRQYHTKNDERVAKSVANRKAYQKRKMKANTRNDTVFTASEHMEVGMVGVDMADQELFAPSTNDYPELLAYNSTEEPAYNLSHVEDYRDTPVWCQLDKVKEILEDAIKDGEKLIQRLIGITEVADHEGLETTDLKDFITEISSLMFQVHRAIASISVRLDFSRGWQVKKYPKVLCPRDWDI
ncbi:hypothetical protein PILCRDRAFT_94068 [Piloderma croceum F 1598]|uniref:Uncharacterized protein n=1 Tax=Piloderma croceum (strain F 1598) TaxID=765440 RepID=A0A0C3AB14_PILCF|nr:hypothetical protein PILCRDRAFT_94068 [Piloderma croceum F 1598]